MRAIWNIFEKLSQTNALIIADQWKYDGEYAFYNMTADPEDYEEFTDEALRNENDHYQAICEGELAGYFCVFQENSVIEIGLGLRPDICGKGIGRTFLEKILRYIDDHYSFESYVINVAAFNYRAIKVYRSCGFRDVQVEDRETNGGVYPFLRMMKGR